MPPPRGYLEIILGPMFSGKTTCLIDLYHSYQEDDKKVLVINYSEDKRYHDSKLSTHDKVMIPCSFLFHLRDVIDKNMLDGIDVILINEGQFFADIFETVIELVETHQKCVHICGLDGDFKQEKIGHILDIIPLCDSIQKLKALCKCGEPAIFSKRLSEETDQYQPNAQYIPVCRKCL